MVSHMKTTIHIPDSLLNEARKVATEQRTTLKALVEEGLRRVVSERKRQSGFKLRKATFRGKGLQPQLEGAGWDRIRDLIYEDRGG
jgi:Arc/MetJ family transcription regulator